ncbi:immunity 26/phosphotriesterase HocA family protein [Arthrobacter zhaoxinii]|uniref:Immunity 26/phosphotriesterase HocA family protein n=1 Tax=Arthrobacter zhaoxinii TaxID=2964616 RepID=A0ABY5YTM7_9MICC|nr:immunity 26/phosphotriesterase HocA family protein [Arthrobacter zhaoxinii]UWX98481.1 immunity 26/phosphotriesterase HocA family protein [Arthrobacter zhaoxinii]
MKDGDVFKIPLGDGRAAVGQVVSSYIGEYYVIIYDFVAPEEEVPSMVSEALESKPLFAGSSLGGRFRSGRWKVLGNMPVDGRKFLPAYKIGWRIPGEYVVENFWGTRRRRATDLEVQILPFRATHSAAFFEHAMQAHVGLNAWHEAFDDVLVGDIVTSADLFDD